MLNNKFRLRLITIWLFLTALTDISMLSGKENLSEANNADWRLALELSGIMLKSNDFSNLYGGKIGLYIGKTISFGLHVEWYDKGYVKGSKTVSPSYSETSSLSYIGFNFSTDNLYHNHTIYVGTELGFSWALWTYEEQTLKNDRGFRRYERSYYEEESKTTFAPKVYLGCRLRFLKLELGYLKSFKKVAVRGISPIELSGLQFSLGLIGRF